MHHVKTSFFLSGLYLLIALFLVYLCFSAKAYIVMFPFLLLAMLEVFRIYRKTKFVSTKNHLTREKLDRKEDSQRQKYTVTTIIFGTGSLMLPTMNLLQKSFIKE